jgi:hypothetical protein
METKACGACKKVLPLTDFNKGIDQGYDFRCRACQKLYRQSGSYKDANRERSKADYSNPVKREAQKARMVAYRARLKGTVGKSDI